jgi:hypothetical protein
MESQSKRATEDLDGAPKSLELSAGESDPKQPHPRGTRLRQQEKNQGVTRKGKKVRGFTGPPPFKPPVTLAQSPAGIADETANLPDA